MLPDNNRGMKIIDLNARSVYALRSCGVGHTGLEQVCGLLNLPQPIACKNYDNISNRFGVAAKFIAEKGRGKAKSRLTDSLIDKLQNYFGIARAAWTNIFLHVITWNVVFSRVTQLLHSYRRFSLPLNAHALIM